MERIGLTNNQLKVIAMVSMVLDHIGVALFPETEWLRILGRLAFPIYAFMIAEGCRHTRSMGRYLGLMSTLAIICQIVYFLAMDSLYMCILVTFSLSIGLCWLTRLAMEKNAVLPWLSLLLGLFAVFFLCEILPDLLPHTDYCVDYGFLGALLPVCIFAAGKNRVPQVLSTLFFLVCMAQADTLLWWSLLAIPLLLLYNGQRGKWKIKWFFYLFYPAHLVIIQAVALLMQRQ